MVKKIRGIAILLISLFFLVSCDLIKLPNEGVVLENYIDEDVSTMAISDLENTEHFRNGALEHILEGELNGRGQAVGFHYDGLPTKKGQIISGTETEPNEQGVYEAKVEVSDVAKTSNGGKSSFCQDEWTAQEDDDAIKAEDEDRKRKTG